jgi:heat-inducible transcriptional repressor
LSLSSLRALQWEDISKGLHGAMCCRSHNAPLNLCASRLPNWAMNAWSVQGMITLLDEPEFSDIQEARRAMRLFEDDETLSGLLRAPLEQQSIEQYAVVIGREHHVVDNAAAQRFSLVGIAYGVGGEVLGTVGVMGPTRMKYADAVSIVPRWRRACKTVWKHCKFSSLEI